MEVLMKQIYHRFLWILALCYWLHYALVNGQSYGDLRLSQGHEGLLEIYYNGWGYVCESGWDFKDSNVACRSLGYGSAYTYRTRYSHPNQTIQFNINNVNCNGNESNLLECDFSTSVTYCRYYNHVYLDCSFDHCQSYLYDSGNSAQVVQYFNGQDWFYICKDKFSEKNAHVICYENYGTEALNYAYAEGRSLLFGYSFYPYQLKCKGDEASICNCPIERQTCSSFEAVEVFCKKPDYLMIRLTKNPEEFLQAYMDSRWLYVCVVIDEYDTKEYIDYIQSIYSETMDLACRELGYSRAKSFELNFSFRSSESEFYLVLRECTQYDTKISNCVDTEWGYYPYHSRAYCQTRISLRCEESCNSFLPFNITTDSYEPLQIYSDKSWFYICFDGFTEYDADVICRETAFSNAISLEALSLDHFLHLHSISPYKYSCTGNELSICACPSERSVCNSNTVVKLSCAMPKLGSTRLSLDYYGDIKIYNGEWRRVCDNAFNLLKADIICRSAGFRKASSYYQLNFEITGRNFRYHFSYYHIFHSGSSIGVVHCFGNETSLLDCSYYNISSVPYYSSCNFVNFVTCGKGDCEIYFQNATENFQIIEYLVDQQSYYLCAEGFTTENADVVCREKANTLSNSYRGIFKWNLSPNIQIYPMRHSCVGNESSLCNCSIFSDYCPGRSVVEIQCQTREGCQSYVSNAVSNPQIIQVRSYYNDLYYICGDGFAHENADVVCRENEGTTSLSYSNVPNSDLTSDFQFLRKRFKCTGKELTLCDCYTSYEPCPSSSAVKLKCNTPDYGHIRLSNRDAGVLEVYLNQWGYVCDNGWNRVASEVVCKQLGQLSLISFKTGVEVSKFLYQFLLDGVECTGNESTIYECTHTLRHNCRRGKHVSVTCSSGQTIATPPTTTNITPVTVIDRAATITTPSRTTITPGRTITTPGRTITTPDRTMTTTETTHTTSASFYFSVIKTTVFPGNQPIITSPNRNIQITITDLTMHANFHLHQECIATGFPQPTVRWTGNLSMKFIRGNVLMIKPGDLGEINPLSFVCIAENSQGKDTKIVKILIKIDLTRILDEFIYLTDEEATNIAQIITANTNGVNTSGGNISEIHQELVKNAMDLEILVVKLMLNRNSSDVVINILNTAQVIIRKDGELREDHEIMDKVVMEQNSIAPASPILGTTLKTIDNLGSKVTLNLEKGTNSTFKVKTITVHAQNINLLKIDPNTQNIVIPEEGSRMEDGMEERIRIPVDNLETLSSNGYLRIATTIIDTMEIRNKNMRENSSKLFSNIISLVMPSRAKTNQKIKLANPVKLVFAISGYDPNHFDQICSFLDDAYWSDEGLRTDGMKNVTACYTNHLTSFAVFVTPRYLGPHNRIASIVSYAVVSISFIFLLISLILFILSGKRFFKVEANIVYFNYCLSLTLAFGLFIFGIETGTFDGILCKIIAFLLHYLWLSVFVWTLCNGILIIYKLTLGVLRQHKIYPYLIVFGWTLPIIIPIITVLVKQDKYVKTDQHCFLTHENGVIWAFIAPIMAIIFLNMIILIISVIRISTTKFGSEKLKEKQIIKSALVSTLILTPLLGIPWIILLLNLFIENPIVQWGFIIINGLMGIFFFFAITMRNPEVLKLLKRKKGRYFQVSSSPENKSSDMVSKKFKRSISQNTDVLSPTNTGVSKKGEYFPLDRMGTSEAQDDDGKVKSPTESISSRYNSPPRPKNLPKPKSKGSKDESEQEAHYDTPLTVKLDQSNITSNMSAPKDLDADKDSPIQVHSSFNDSSDDTSKRVEEVEGKV